MVWVAVDIVTAAVVADGVHGDDYEYEDERERRRPPLSLVNCQLLLSCSRQIGESISILNFFPPNRDPLSAFPQQLLRLLCYLDSMLQMMCNLQNLNLLFPNKTQINDSYTLIVSSLIESNHNRL